MWQIYLYLVGPAGKIGYQNFNDVAWVLYLDFFGRFLALILSSCTVTAKSGFSKHSALQDYLLALPMFILLKKAYTILCFSYRDAFLFVQQRRFCVSPNEGFVQQLTVSCNR